MKQVILSVLLVLGMLGNVVLAAEVNINTADAKTIAKSLSGIGKKRAQAIVDYRTKHGEFEVLADVLEVRGVSAKALVKNAEDIKFK